MHQQDILWYAGGSILFKRSNKRYSWSTSRTLAVIILRWSNCNFSMCKRSVDIWGHLYHVLSVNSLIQKCHLYQHVKGSPNVGLEPTTLGLRVPCSTDWANRAYTISSDLPFGSLLFIIMFFFYFFHFFFFLILLLLLLLLKILSAHHHTCLYRYPVHTLSFFKIFLNQY